jgi:cell wall-associated NlpC family hydrolase
MKNHFFIGLLVLIIGLAGCSTTKKTTSPEKINIGQIKSTVVIKKNVAPRKIDVKNVSAPDVVAFALTLLGTPYKYGSVKKENGFDCSGFVNYVFNNFSIKVPRTTVDFTNAGKEVSLKESRAGDLVLFTGSDVNSGIVGHMGIITKNIKNEFLFIHAASGKNGGVILSSLNAYFIPRFVKVIRIFNPA